MSTSTTSTTLGLAVSETQFETWSHQGAIDSSKKTYASVQYALSQSQRLNLHGFDVFLQGSYGNDTNIRADSDVDVVVTLTDAFRRDLANLTPPELLLYNNSFSTASYGIAEFRKDVLDQMIAYYGKALVIEGKNSIKLKPASGRLGADVIVSLEHRRYIRFNGVHDQSFVQGIAFDRLDGVSITNYPKIHSANCTAKHKATNGWFKPTVRIFKNMRRRLTDSHIRVADLYQQFGRDPRLPKLLSGRTVLNTIEDAVRRGVLAVRCVRTDQSEAWFWRSNIDVTDWGKSAEAWLPAQATLNALSSAAVLPSALSGLWPKTDDGVKLSELFSWFDGTHCFEEETQPGYPPEMRPIPKVDYAIVKKAVSKAIQDGGLWLVYGNDSVFSEAPTTIQLDADALLFRPPATLAAMDLLPTALTDAWTKETEPKTTVSALYADLKAKRGRPWPTKLFLDSLNAALGQGFIHRVSGTGPISSLQNDGSTELMIRSAAPKPPEPPPSQTPAGRRASSLAVLSISEIQDLADQIHTLTKPLAGMDPQIEVRITVKTKGDGDLSLANSILDKIKAGWKL